MERAEDLLDELLDALILAMPKGPDKKRAIANLEQCGLYCLGKLAP